MRNDARKSFRIQTPEHQQRGVFLLGRQRFPVLMLNASADGFAFLSPQKFGVALGTVARLQADDAWYEVLVVRSEEAEEGFLLGVERLADLKSADGESSHWAMSQSGDAATLVSTVLAVAGVVLCAFLSAYLIAGRPDFDALLGSFVSANQTAESVITPVPISHAPQGTADSSKSLTRQTLPKSVHDSREVETALAARQRALLGDEMASKLQLTAIQRRELDRVLDRDDRANKGEAAWELIRQDEARILQILTPKQIDRWRGTLN
jgi:hypothetical protein